MGNEVWDATGACIDCQQSFDLPKIEIGHRVRCKSCFGAWRNEGQPSKKIPIQRAYPGESKLPQASAMALAIAKSYEQNGWGSPPTR